VTWDVKLRTRKKIVEVREILREWPEHAADFPGMRIRDLKGREHEFSYLDLGFSFQKWNEIQVGTKIELTLEEKVVEARLLPKKS